MEDTTKDMMDLFAKAKSAPVNYPIKNISALVGAAGIAGAAAGASSFFNLSKIVIMIGSIFTIVTVAVVMNTGGDKPQVESETLEVTNHQNITKERALQDMPERMLIEENELKEVLPIENNLDLEEVESTVPVMVELEETEDVSVSDKSGQNLASFHSVHLNMSADVTIIKGSKSAVTFKGDTDLAQYLDIDVANGVVRIGIKDGKEREYRRNSDYNSQIELVLTMNEIKSLVINGSGDIYSPDNIRSDELFVQINGSGDVKLDRTVPGNFELSVNGSGDVSLYGEGEMSNGTININGSGDVCTKSIDISVIDININGSGDVNVSCNETLNVDLLGSGDVCYKGSPEINVNQMGSGDIHNCQH